MIGKIISYYKICEKLGEGGMGVVYKAEDTKLKRIVALKFLLQHLTAIETDKARFLQEAQAASAINHPNVCVIHDIQEYEGQQFIVMEYVEGKTLREIISNTLPHVLNLKEVTDYAIQIAEALEAAHEQSIIHRDIKSENIMLNTKNQIKVMDFGLAKLKGSLKLTKTSSTLGTVAYMSPEQIQGQEVDARSDIFSFGVLLYEMLTGQLPFKGDYEAAMTYAIVNEAPEPVQKYRPDLSSEFLHVINRALEKEPGNRYQSMKDVLIDLKRVKRETSQKSIKVMESTFKAFQPPVTTGPKRRKTSRIGQWALLAILIIAIIIITAVGIKIFQPFQNPSAKLPRIVPFTSFPGFEYYPTFSPDGKQIAFSWNGENGEDYDIYVQLIGTNEPLRLTQQQGNELHPTWSPDGRSIAFNRYQNDDERGIYVIPALGGLERRVYPKPGGILSWSPLGDLLAFTDFDSAGIVMLSLETLEIRRLTSAPIDNPFAGDSYAAFSPDGKSLAFVRNQGWKYGDIYTIPIPCGKPKRLTSDNNDIMGLTWTPDGHEIIFSSDRAGGLYRLWRIKANGGTPDLIAAGVQNARFPTISSDGLRLAYIEYILSSDIWRVAMPESPAQLNIPSKFIASTQVDESFDFSPDGKRIVFNSMRSGQSEIWICNSAGKNAMQLTFLDSYSGSPRWSPDGKNIAFDSRPEASSDIYIVAAQGGTPKQMTTEPSNDVIPFWSHDGRWLYFSSNRSGVAQIWKMPAVGGKAIQVTQDGGFSGAVSEDGKWLYYSKTKTPIWRIPTTGGKKSLILDDDTIGFSQWSINNFGICYAKFNTMNKTYNIEFFDFATNEKSIIFSLKGKDRVFIDYPRISPDGEWLFYTLVGVNQADIKLVENWMY
jgi:Tol biopolymer transport system component/tRNA A-37 threonylcarbamoyl transferase component Bud32